MGSTSIVLQSSILLVYYLCPICLGDYMEKIIVLEIVMKKSVVSEGYPGFPCSSIAAMKKVQFFFETLQYIYDVFFKFHSKV